MKHLLRDSAVCSVTNRTTPSAWLLLVPVASFFPMLLQPTTSAQPKRRLHQPRSFRLPEKSFVLNNFPITNSAHSFTYLFFFHISFMLFLFFLYTRLLFLFFVRLRLRLRSRRASRFSHFLQRFQYFSSSNLALTFSSSSSFSSHPSSASSSAVESGSEAKVLLDCVISCKEIRMKFYLRPLY